MAFLSPDVKENMAKKLPTIIIGSLSLVAGLAWNDGFSSLINQYVPEKYKGKDNAWFKIIYAFVLTIFIVIAITMILRFSPKD